MITPLVRTKLYPLARRAGLVARPRLLERIQQGLNGRLTLLSAPAGYGKTTLLGDLVAAQAGLEGRRLAWLSLDVDDNDPVRFWSGVTAALQTIDPQIGSESLSLLHAAQPQAGPHQASQRFLAQLINELLTYLQGVSYDLLLIVDDYHTITHPVIQGGMEYLIDHLPERMRLVIATRADPPLPLARWRGRGELQELRQNDLRFTSQEADELLSRALGFRLAREDVDSLANRTEGWAAGLQLTAISLRDQPDIPAYIHSLTGSTPFVLDYLLEEILLRQPQPVQDFLLRTSILESMCAPLCDALLEAPAGDDGAPSQQVLETLLRANLFIVPLDDQRAWFRYHHLFATLLRQRLQRARPDLLPELHARASAWYANQGYRNEAVRHAISSGLFDRAANLIAGYAQETLMRSEIATFLSWVAALPEQVLLEHPLLIVYRTAMLLLSGGPVDEAEAALDKIRQADGHGKLSGELNAVCAMIAAYRGDLSNSMALAQQALEQISEDNLFLKSFLAGLLGLNALIHGSDSSRADQVLDEAYRLALRSGNLISAIIALSHRGELATFRGDLALAKAHYQKAHQLAVDQDGKLLPVAGLVFGGLGTLLRLQGQLEAALQQLETGLALNIRWSLIASLNTHLEKARILRLRADFPAASHSMQCALELAEMFDAMLYDDLMVQVEQARLWLAQGRLAEVQAWAQSSGLSPEGTAPDEQAGNYTRLIGANQAQALAQLYLAKKQPTLALKILAPWVRLLEEQGLNLLLVDCLCLQALAYWQKLNSQLACSSLLWALRLAQAPEIVFPFLEGGPPMRQLLAATLREREAESRPVHGQATTGVPATDTLTGFIIRLLEALGEPQPARSIPPSSAIAPAPAAPVGINAPVEPLSERELEVLVLVAQGYSNQEIAAEMVVSLHTVKWHLGNIFSKLGVKNRSQAVAYARKLGLLN